MTEYEMWLQIGEAAKRLNVKPGTLHNWVEKGYISAYRMPSRRLKFHVHEVEIKRRLWGGEPPRVAEKRLKAEAEARAALERAEADGDGVEVSPDEYQMEIDDYMN